MPQPYHSAGGKGSSAPHHGAGTTVRCTGYAAKVQEAGWGARVKGAGTPQPVKVQEAGCGVVWLCHLCMVGGRDGEI